MRTLALTVFLRSPLFHNVQPVRMARVLLLEHLRQTLHSRILALEADQKPRCKAHSPHCPADQFLNNLLDLLDSFLVKLHQDQQKR